MSTAVSDRIEKKVLLRASRARVWRAVSDAKEFGQWFGVVLSGPFAPGARLTGKVTHKGYEDYPFELTVERVEPERLFSFRWHPSAHDREADYSAEPTTLIEFKLEEAAGGILLTVVESGFDGIPLARRAKAFADNEQGWAQQMQAIERYLAQSA